MRVVYFRIGFTAKFCEAGTCLRTNDKFYSKNVTISKDKFQVVDKPLQIHHTQRCHPMLATTSGMREVMLKSCSLFRVSHCECRFPAEIISLAVLPTCYFFERNFLFVESGRLSARSKSARRIPSHQLAQRYSFDLAKLHVSSDVSRR